VFKIRQKNGDKTKTKCQWKRNQKTGTNNVNKAKCEYKQLDKNEGMKVILIIVILLLLLFGIYYIEDIINIIITKTKLKKKKGVKL